MNVLFFLYSFFLLLGEKLKKQNVCVLYFSILVFLLLFFQNNVGEMCEMCFYTYCPNINCNRSYLVLKMMNYNLRNVD